MGKKLTNTKFIDKCKIVHNDEYDYSLVNYINSNVKVEIICKKHGIYQQIPSSHLFGRGCPFCYGTPRNNQIDFITKCKEIHKNKYDYSLVEYKNTHLKIKIICIEHGIFEQESRSHLRGNGCPHCAGLAKYNTITFIEKCNLKHNNKYDYSLIEYKNLNSKIKIICFKHGIFEQISNEHLNGSGCPKCSNKFRYNNKTFIEKSTEIHGKKYDYSLVEYKNNKSKIKLICPKHGIFETRPDNHINSKNGCPKCSESIGEKKIREFLIKNNIIFETEKRFKDCRYKNPLPFDFYLPEINTCIEFDGQQHFNKWNKWNDKESDLELRIKRDKIKTQYCLDNNIKLLRIKYDENINDKINDLFIRK